jgi:hypothetical protein
MKPEAPKIISKEFRKRKGRRRNRLFVVVPPIPFSWSCLPDFVSLVACTINIS